MSDKMSSLKEGFIAQFAVIVEVALQASVCVYKYVLFF